MKNSENQKIDKAKKKLAIILTEFKNSGEVSQIHKKWIAGYILKHKKGKETIPTSITLLLDSISPIIGYDWRLDIVDGKLKKFEEKFDEVYDDLKNKNGDNLKKNFWWINHQRSKYAKSPKTFPKPLIKKLDLLNPYLGYDWKYTGGSRNIAFNKNINDIKKRLKNNKKLTEIQATWLIRKAKTLKKNPNRLDTKHLKSLDSLIPLLGYDWRVPVHKKKKITHSMLSDLKSKLQNKEHITGAVQLWLYKQRASYINRPDSFSKETKKSLDNLIPLLGYDWKTPRSIKSNETLQERVSRLKLELKRNSNLNNRDKHWLENIRRKYKKDKNAIVAADISKLNELNDYLTTPWQETTKSIRSSFASRIEAIRSSNLAYDKLPECSLRWIYEQRKRYNELGDQFPIEDKQQLDSISPIIGGDWSKPFKKQYNSKQFDLHYKKIKETLGKELLLERAEQNYLSRRRLLYLRGEFNDKKAIEKLDSLIPLLGYDWKKIRQKRKKIKTFEEHINDISEKLKANKHLNKTQREFLRLKRIQYQNSPEDFPENQFKTLNNLIPLLERDWKKKIINYGDSFLFKTRIKLLEEKLKSFEDLDQNDKDFLRKQRYQYRKDPKIYDKSRVLLLNKLNDVLGYDWKLYVKER